jgi:hypothetical protein
MQKAMISKDITNVVFSTRIAFDGSLQYLHLSSGGAVYVFLLIMLLTAGLWIQGMG